MLGVQMEASAKAKEHLYRYRENSKWMKCGQPGNLGEGKWELFVLFPQNYENKIAS